MEKGRNRVQERSALHALPILRVALWSMFYISSAEVIAEQNAQDLMCGPGFELVYPNEPRNACFVSSQDVIKRTLPYQVIDVRPRPSGQPAPGTLVMTTRELIHKPFLKDKELLLIDSSFGSVQQMDWCHRLQDAGFQSVRYLQGGERAYSALINTSQTGNKPSAGVSPSNFWSEWNNGTIRIVAVDEAVQGSLEQLGIQVDLLFSENELKGISELMALVETNQESSFAPIVLVSENSDHARELAESLQIVNLFYLEAGSKGLKKFIEQNAAVIRQRNGSQSRGLMCNA